MSASSDAQARLEDAKVFLDAAKVIDTLIDEESYAEAIGVLKAAGGDSATLSRLLGETTKAAYNVQSLTRSGSSKCIDWVEKLLVAAEEKDSRGVMA